MERPEKQQQQQLQELPTCPVCLERMDTVISGIVTTICHHSFHCNCLSKWGDSTCPVCRYSQKRVTVAAAAAEESIGAAAANAHACSTCQSQQNLWICLICGHIGCGRYQAAHAHSHYTTTNHLYAMELETQRVWDYAGDGYVHRLIQNKADGKLVELDGGQSGQPTTNYNNHNNSYDSINNNSNNDMNNNYRSMTIAAEKLDALGLEFSYLLTSSLESQRQFYEEQLGQSMEVISQLQRQLDAMQLAQQLTLHQTTSQHEETLVSAREQVDQLARDKHQAQRKEHQLERRVHDLERTIDEERALVELLRANQTQWQTQLEHKERALHQMDAERHELQDQLRDVMAFLDARNQLEQKVAAETSYHGRRAIVEGSVVLVAPDPSLARPPPPPPSAAAAPPLPAASKKKKRTRK